MNIDPNVTGYIPSMSVGYKYNYWKLLGFNAPEGAGSTDPSDPCLSCFPGKYSNVSICPVFFSPILGRYFNACNAIVNHNMMQRSDLALDK